MDRIYCKAIIEKYCNIWLSITQKASNTIIRQIFMWDIGVWQYLESSRKHTNRYTAKSKTTLQRN